jgi:hypothetical protein
VFKLSNWSYSRYSSWKKCPALLKFDHESTIPRVASPAMSRGTIAHKVFEDFILGTDEKLHDYEYYRVYLEKLREANAVPEHPIALDKDWKPCEWDDPNRWWRGVLDLVVMAPNEAIIVDWKTGQEYPDHRDQREIYAAAYHSVDPTVDYIRVIHTYIDKKQNTSTLFHRDDIPKLKANWEGRVAPMLADTLFVPNPGWHCRSCRFSKNEGGPCPF